MRELIQITKALADENRVRILMALTSGELCLCQLIEFLELAPSTVSKHLSILNQARLVKGRKEGRWHYYSLVEAGEEPQAASALEWLRENLDCCPNLEGDRARIRDILCLEKEACCARYR